MKVSVITVCLNSNETIEQTIRSIIGQTYKDMEYIIIDGGSDDGTKEIIERYRDHISVYISEPDEGIYDAMNKGIRMSTGQIIGIVNSDDWLEADAVETVANVFETEDTDIVYGNVNEIKNNRPVSVLRSVDKLDDDNVWAEMPVWHPATFISRDVYERIGGYSTRYRISSDYDFIIRCFLNHERFFYLDKVLSNFRNEGLSSRELLFCAEENRTIISEYKDKVKDFDKIIDFYDEYIKCLIFEKKAGDQPQEIVSTLSEMTGGDREIIIWGLGKMGRICLEVVSKGGMTVRKVVDGSKAGEHYGGYEVEEPEAIKNTDVPVLVAIMKFKKEEADSLNLKGPVVLLDEWIDRILGE